MVPSKARFFRGQMTTIISRALNELGIKPLPSRRCFSIMGARAARLAAAECGGAGQRTQRGGLTGWQLGSCGQACKHTGLPHHCMPANTSPRQPATRMHEPTLAPLACCCLRPGLLSERLEGVYKADARYSDKAASLFTLDLGAPEVRRAAERLRCTLTPGLRVCGRSSCRFACLQAAACGVWHSCRCSPLQALGLV